MPPDEWPRDSWQLSDMTELALLWESGVGADLSARTAAPVVGGLWSAMFLTLLVLPAAYAIRRRWQFNHPRLGAPVGV